MYNCLLGENYSAWLRDGLCSMTNLIISKLCIVRSGLPHNDELSYWYTALEDLNCLGGLIDSGTDMYHVQNEGCGHE